MGYPTVIADSDESGEDEYDNDDDDDEDDDEWNYIKVEEKDGSQKKVRYNYIPANPMFNLLDQLYQL